MWFDILKIAVIAFIFTKLQEPGMIFAWYAKLLDKIQTEWLYNPLGGCLKCFSGQCALWFYLIKNFHDYNFIDHLFFIASVIFLSSILDYLWDQISNSE